MEILYRGVATLRMRLRRAKAMKEFRKVLHRHRSVST
jgi:hypothetical protein